MRWVLKMPRHKGLLVIPRPQARACQLPLGPAEEPDTLKGSIRATFPASLCPSGMMQQHESGGPLEARPPRSTNILGLLGCPPGGRTLTFPLPSEPFPSFSQTELSKNTYWILSPLQLKGTSVALSREVKTLQWLAKPSCPSTPGATFPLALRAPAPWSSLRSSEPSTQFLIG